MTKKKSKKEKITKEEAEQIFKKFIALLYRLIVVEKNRFDLIIGAGDSGAALAMIAKIFYIRLKKKPPQVLLIPTTRFTKLDVPWGDFLDNKTLIPKIKNDLKNRKSPIKNVLFVDDEIRSAYSAKESIRVVINAAPKRIIPNRVLYTIVAENHGFEWHYNIPPVAIRYYAFSNLKRGINNAIFEIIPDSIWHKANDKLPIKSRKELANLLLNRLSKRLKNKTPYFKEFSENEITKQFPQYKQTLKAIQKRIDKLIAQGIAEYKSGKTEFKF